MFARGRFDAPALFKAPIEGGAPVAVNDQPIVRAEQVSATAGRIVYPKLVSSFTHEGPPRDCGGRTCPNPVTNQVSGIAIANLDRSGEVLLTDGGVDGFPSFSPDGTAILFNRLSAPGKPPYSIVVMTLDGKIIRTVDPPPSFEYMYPVWSPDGIGITALRVSYSTPEPQAQVVELREGQAPRVIATGEFTDLSWSHDGKTLAAVRYQRAERDDPPAHPKGSLLGTDVWLIPTDGRVPRRLTHFVTDANPTQATYCGGTGMPQETTSGPLWSRDDRQIAFVSNYRHLDWLGRASEVGIVNADGTGLHWAFRASPPPCPAAPDDIRVVGWSQ